MKKLMHILLLSCLKATELIEKKQLFKLSVIESIQLKLHKMMCDACTKYEKQSILIDKGINNLQQKGPVVIDIEKLKKRISQNLKKS
ncbi:MAG: hypothetical protein U9R19_01040 [Bacteroidota bacterium]|nr:hypothetical protein [Bacteroidota bacterium]